MSRRIPWSKDGTLFYGGDTIAKAARSQSQMDNADSEPWSSTGENIAYSTTGDYLIWNFPAPVTIDRIKLMVSSSRGAITAQVSDDTDLFAVPGVHGTWTTVRDAQAPGSQTLEDWTITTPTESRWFRLQAADWWLVTYVLHLYGEYTTPRLQIYDAGGLAPITDSTFLDFSVAQSDSNYTESKVFSIKNNDTADHTYTVTIDQQQTADVPFVTDAFSLTSTSNPVASTSFTTPLVTSGGGFSEDITITASIDAVDNPKNGWYYPKVTIEEAT